MATKPNRPAPDRPGRPNDPEPNPRIREMGPGTSEVVRRATEVLESELSTGLDAARRAQERFRKERRVEAGDFEAAVSRFRADGHALVDLARDLTRGLRSETAGDLTERLTRDAHDALDLALSLVDLAPDLINRAVRLTDDGGTDKGGGVENAEAGAAGPARQRSGSSGGARKGGAASSRAKSGGSRSRKGAGS